MADYNVPLYWTELIYGTLLSPSPLWISDGQAGTRRDVKESVWILCKSGWCFAWMSFGSAALTPHLYWFVNEKDRSLLAGCIFPWLQSTWSVMMLQQQLKSWAQDFFFFRNSTKFANQETNNWRSAAGVSVRRSPIMNHCIPTCCHPLLSCIPLIFLTVVHSERAALFHSLMVWGAYNTVVPGDRDLHIAAVLHCVVLYWHSRPASRYTVKTQTPFYAVACPPPPFTSTSNS